MRLLLNDDDGHAEGTSGLALVLGCVLGCIALVGLLAICISKKGKKTGNEDPVSITPQRPTMPVPQPNGPIMEQKAGHKVAHHWPPPGTIEKSPSPSTGTPPKPHPPPKITGGGIYNANVVGEGDTAGESGISETANTVIGDPAMGNPTVEATIETLKEVCDVMGGAIQPQCHLQRDTIRAGMHSAVAEVTNKFKTEVTAFFFPDPSRMDKHMKMYQKQVIRDFMPIISEWRPPMVYTDRIGRSVHLPGHVFVDRCETLREAMEQCRTQRDVLHELFTVCQHITRQLVVMHKRKIAIRDINIRNVVRASVGQQRNWTFLEYAGAVKCGAKTESMPVRCTPPELAQGRMQGLPMIVQQSYDMWQLGVFIYELSTNRSYWAPRLTDGQVLDGLTSPQRRLPHESKPVSIDLVNRILKQLLTRDEESRVDAVKLKAMLDHEEETGTLSSTMNAMPPVSQPGVVLET